MSRTSSTCLLLNPITFTLPVLLALLGLFQGAFVKTGQKPTARPLRAGRFPQHLHSPLRWSVRSLGRGGAATQGRGSLGQGAAGILPQAPDAMHGRWGFC